MKGEKYQIDSGILVKKKKPFLEISDPSKWMKDYPAVHKLN